MSSPPLAISLRDVSHAYGQTQALKNICLSVKSDEQVALIGSSGCGKTTLLRLIGTQLPPQSGTIEVLGNNLSSIPPKQLKHLRSRIAMIPQHLGLTPNVNVLRNVLNGGVGSLNLLQTIRQLIIPKSSEVKRAYELLDRTGIGSKIYERTDQLSGGQQQRVAVARSLYQNPSLMLADEPVSAIDPTRAHDLIKLLTKLSQEEQIPLIVSLHNIKLAREFFPRIIGLREGQIVYDGSPKELDDPTCEELFKFSSTSNQR